MNLKRINHPVTWIAAGIIVAGISFAFWYQSAEAVPLPTPLTSSPPAPDFTLPGINGTVVKLSDFRGRLVVLELWRPDCESCLQEVHALMRLRRDLRKELAAVVAAIGTDAATARTALCGLNRDFTVVVDDGTIQKAYPGDTLPRTYFIDKDGRLRAVVPKHPNYPYHYFRRLALSIITDAQ